MTPIDPGRTQSGRPMTSVAAHAVTMTAAAAAAQMAKARVSLTLPPRRMAGTGPMSPLVVADWSTRTRSLACWGRSTASLARQRITSAASWGGRSGRSASRSRGASVMWAAMRRAAEVAWKRGSPASSSYAMAPKE